MNVLDHRPSDRNAVERARSAPDLVQDQQAALGGVVQDVGGFDQHRATQVVSLLFHAFLDATLLYDEDINAHVLFLE